MNRVIDGETEIKSNKQLKKIKNKLEKLMSKKIIRIECIRVPIDFYEYIKGLTEDMEFFYFRAFKDEEVLNIEIEDFIKEYKNFTKK